ncbi:MAG TPA: hypothetical protein VMG31_05815 [Verrucomicrobiae bacterium]|nr:hypothetical protein [Verrucomicrobiae bacterium]
MEPRTDQDPNGDFLLLLTLRVPVPFAYGIVVLPEPHAFEHGFVDGDIVRYVGGKEMLAPEGGSGRLMKVAASACEKITDPKMAESYRRIIFRPDF